ncbi:hypothetical protein KFL_000690300 [Klebsormidium nitens]|uniref:Uncharacterized protein n=1 Tax=Klebsormidium nitens TaxID=105231 RepID=A0A1Y1HT98_KLENI|nr:hypothetical protein KFL_000690300 [Klebsormidium nitens]|eukprot:GAQ81052.1 hypothetical protein KFL_000690300 [Klebsormidium nitens]
MASHKPLKRPNVRTLLKRKLHIVPSTSAKLFLHYPAAVRRKRKKRKLSGAGLKLESRTSRRSATALVQTPVCTLSNTTTRSFTTANCIAALRLLGYGIF